jgi:uncharacterized protein
MKATPVTAGISFPPRIGPDGRVAVSADNDNIRECMHIILMTSHGERINLPSFGGGLQKFLFQPNTTTTRSLIEERIMLSLKNWEPRIEIDALSVEEDPDDPRSAIATVVYRLAATGIKETVNLTITMGL